MCNLYAAVYMIRLQQLLLSSINNKIPFINICALMNFSNSIVYRLHLQAQFILFSFHLYYYFFSALFFIENFYKAKKFAPSSCQHDTTVTL